MATPGVGRRRSSIAVALIAATLLPILAFSGVGNAATTTTTTAATTTTTTVAPSTTSGAAEVGANATPTRGTQKQLTEPPPPPTTQPPEWALPANSGVGRRAVYSKSAQRVWAVDEAGVVVKTHRVSGKQTPLDPRPGTYRVWSRSRYTNSIERPSITWGYMIRFATGARGGNIGFHEIPSEYGRKLQTEAQLGQALSGGCVRQATSDAIWMWNWAYIGTVVVVLP